MEEIEALQARDTDAEEDARFGGSLRGDELPEELRCREDRLAAIVAAKARAAQREADDARGRGESLRDANRGLAYQEIWNFKPTPCSGAAGSLSRRSTSRARSSAEPSPKRPPRP